MCLICIDFQRGTLKLPEARRALREMRDGLSADHVREVEEQLSRAEREAADGSAPAGPTNTP